MHLKGTPKYIESIQKKHLIRQRLGICPLFMVINNFIKKRKRTIQVHMKYTREEPKQKNKKDQENHEN
jgi:hypothetical protein